MGWCNKTALTLSLSKGVSWGFDKLSLSAFGVFGDAQ